MIKPNYGFDAPGLVRGFLIGALVLLGFGIAVLNFSPSFGSWPKNDWNRLSISLALSFWHVLPYVLREPHR
jgi:hypothetical protein